MNDNTLTINRLEPSKQQAWLENSIVSGIASLLSPPRTAGLLSIVALGSTLGIPVTTTHATPPEYAVVRVSPQSSLVYTGVRGDTLMDRRRQIRAFVTGQTAAKLPLSRARSTVRETWDREHSKKRIPTMRFTTGTATPLERNPRPRG